MNWPIFKLNEEHFTFHLQYKHSGTFANRKYEELVGIRPILLENPESRSICDRDRKNRSRFWHLFLNFQMSSLWYHEWHQTWQSQYLTEIDIQKTFKNRKKYKINSGTSTRSPANKNKHKHDNRFREHFSQNLFSQKTRNGVSEHQDYKIFLGSMPQTPLMARLFSTHLIRRWWKTTTLYT